MLWYLTQLWLISLVGGKSCPRPHQGLLWEDSSCRGYNREAPGDTGKYTVAFIKLNSISVFVPCHLPVSGRPQGDSCPDSQKTAGHLCFPRDFMCLGATVQPPSKRSCSGSYHCASSAEINRPSTFHLCFLPSLESRQGCPEWISCVIETAEA